MASSKVTFDSSNQKQAVAIRVAAARDAQAWERKPAAGVPVKTTGQTKVG